MRLLFIIVSISLLITACTDQEVSKSVQINGQTMGTTYSVTYKPIADGPERDALYKEIELLLTEINQSMSTYIDDSELSRFNQTEAGLETMLSKELFYVIKSAVKVSQISDGAFDITVGPLVNLWGFGPTPVHRQPPPETELQRVQEFIGYEKLSLDPDKLSISKANENMYIDLSGIAKGYAVDRIAQHMDSYDIQHYLIDIGGDLLALGVNDENQPWQIGIEQARPYSREVQRIVSLDKKAMATSGDYRNYFEQNGIRYSHTLDPKTGAPITHSLASVTVLHESCMFADALATALMVMGPEAALELANQQQLPIYMLVKSENDFIERYNESFRIYLSN